MDTLLDIVPVVGVLMVAGWFWFTSGRVRRDLPYTRRPSLLTATELRFSRMLVGAVPPHLVALMKVRLDVVCVPDSAWEQFGAPGSGMHLDFVLADPETLARKRDLFKDSALASAIVPILRVRAAGRDDVDEMRSKIARVLGC